MGRKVLLNTVNGARDFFARYDINSFPQEYSGSRIILEFALNLKSFVTPEEITDYFRFKMVIELKGKKAINYNIQTAEGYPIPFHPHFTPEGIWQDYKKEKQNVKEYLYRMIHSLQFYKDYIYPKSQYIGNQKALQWYLEQLNWEPKNFPTDNVYNRKRAPIDKRTKKVLDQTSEDSGQETHEVQFSPSGKKFTITQKLPYTLKEKTFSFNHFDFEENSKSKFSNPKSYTGPQSHSILCISQKAKIQIWQHIGWGEKNSAINTNEQGGILLGNVYRDTEKSIVHGLVTQVVTTDLAQGKPAYLKMTHEAWSQMLNDADFIIDANPDKDLQVIGWYHTHPNNLDVFMSGTDLNTQQKFFYQKWHYAVVLNPHREYWRVFIGAEAKECQGFILKDDTILEEEEKNNDEESNDPSKNALLDS